jgi:hypothetical protein
MEYNNQALNGVEYEGSDYSEQDQYQQEEDFEEDYGPGYAIMSDGSSTVASMTRRRKTRESYESADKNLHKLVRMFDRKCVEISVYTSSACPGACIRDAITGTRYKDYRVGSINEHQFYKVKFATGEMGQDSGSCFFDSPEQYEKHMRASVPIEEKNRWADKCANVRKMYDEY